MTKRFLPLLLCLLLLLGGCTEQVSTKAIVPDTLLTELTAGECFSETLEPLDSDIIPLLMGMDSSLVAAATGLFSTGATSECAVVITATDTAALSTLQKAVEQWIADQIAAVENYQPNEVPKLENAAIKTSELYLVVVVSNDNAKASTVLAPYFA